MVRSAFIPPLKHPPRATATPSSSPTCPPSPDTKPATSDSNVSKTTRQTYKSRSRNYRCSRCGKAGHNVRRCPTPHVWFRQRCSQCGGTGHNARNCPNTTTCRVCGGLGRLPCAQCGGKGFHASPEDKRSFSDAQKIMAENIRQRVRRVVGAVGDDGLVLVGSDNAGARCKRCMGRGFLSCMACSDE